MNCIRIRLGETDSDIKIILTGSERSLIIAQMGNSSNLRIGMRDIINNYKQNAPRIRGARQLGLLCKLLCVINTNEINIFMAIAFAL